MPNPASLPEGVRRLAFASLGSTNVEAMRLAAEGDPGNVWITAVEQTAGKARRGRSWVSARGNLHATLLLIDPAPAGVTPTLSFVAGVALHEALAPLLGAGAAAGLRLKWPNDLLLAGGKVAGILVEGAGLPAGRRAVAVGIGVNCTNHPAVTAASYVAADLRGLGHSVDAEELFSRLASAMSRELARWDQGEGFATIRRRWLDRALGPGQAVRVNLVDRTIEGTFEALDAAGRLVVATKAGGRETVAAGDLFILGGEAR